MNTSQTALITVERKNRGASYHFLVVSFLLLILAWGPNVMSQSGSYHLIAGSFKGMKAANELVDVLRMKGYSPIILFPGNGTSNYRVSVYQAANREEVKTFQKQINGKSYWILDMTPPGFASTSTLPSTGSRLGNYPTPAPTSPITSTTTSYHLILGSFPSRDAAERSLLALSNQGYEPYILYPDAQSSNYRISVFRATDKRQVEAYQNNLKRAGRANTGWIYEKAVAPGARGLVLPGPVNKRVVQRTYHLISGSFNNYNDANSMSFNMQQQGYPSIVLLPKATTKKYRVSIYQSTNKQEILTLQNTLKNQGKKDYWILEE